MNDQTDSMTGFIKNADNKANLCMLGLSIDRRGEAGFRFYRIDSKLGEALRGRLEEDYHCAGLASRPESTKSVQRAVSLPSPKRANHG